MKKNFFALARLNWRAGLTVSIVAIPLSISLAVAAGATPTQGIITAIWAGIIAGIFGGSNYNITGPTGALSGLLAVYAFSHGSSGLPFLAIVSGIIILVAWAFRLERYLMYVPANTIHGFTLGVALIIGFGQLNFALGLRNLPAHEKFLDNLIESFRHLGGISWPALSTFLIFFATLYALTVWGKKIRGLSSIPPAALVTPFGLLLGYWSTTGSIPIAIQTLGSRFPDIPATIFRPLTLPTSWNGQILVSALTVAVVAILETMLSAKIADGMTRTKHHKRNEMLGLGLANIGSGLAGGIPATAALARTSLNIRSGATHKASAVISSISVAVISIFLIRFFVYIPLPVIAAILALVAVRMVEQEHFVRMWMIDRRSFVVAMIVALITIAIDPITGILVGAGISLFMFLDVLSRGQFDLVMNDINQKIVGRLSGHRIDQITEHSETLVYSIKGHLTYIDSQAHITRFEHQIDNFTNIVLRLRELYFIDLDGIDAFNEIVTLLEKRKKHVFVSGANSLTVHLLRESSVFRRLESDGAVFPTTADALQRLGFQLNANDPV